MRRRGFLHKLSLAISAPGLRTKLIVLLILVMVFPLLVSSWLAKQNAQTMGQRVSSQTLAMTDKMRDSITEIGARTTSDAIQALDNLCREKIERLSTDVAQEIAAFLYERDDDVRIAAGLPVTEGSFRDFLRHRTREVIDHVPWKLDQDQQNWIPTGVSDPVREEVRPALRENSIGFHYRPPDTKCLRTRRPLYLEMTFIDTHGMEKLKVTTSPMLPKELRDVSLKANTYCKAETYFPELKKLKKGEVFVSTVVGPYVVSSINGTYLPDSAAELGIPFEPEHAGYAGKENPVGKRFKGLIRWAAPVFRDGEAIGYVTLALDHTHIMEFTDHLVPTEERTSPISDASRGNYAFLADYDGKIIAHPRQYHIVGYDPVTGKQVPSWLDAETYARWKTSGKEFDEFIKEVPPYDNPSRYRDRSLEQVAAGQMGLDYRYLNFAPQCLGFQTLTQHGGSGSFQLYWSGLWKLNATAAIPYRTGGCGSYPSGFGHVGITANIQEYQSPALETKKFIDWFIVQRDADFAEQQEDLHETISRSVSESIGTLSQYIGIMLAVVIGLAAWIASALRNRVAAVTRGVRQFQDGNLGHRMEVKNRDELGQLAQAFNQMAQSIEASYEKLGKSEQRFRAIFNQTFQLASFLTPDGIILAANTAMLQFVGVAETELVGKACWELPWWTISPERQRHVREAVASAARGELSRFEATSQGSRGDTNFFDFSLKPFNDDAGNVVNLVLEARDITPLKEAEHELRRHRDQLELFVQDRTRELTLANEQLRREILDRKQAEYKVRAERDRAQRYLDIAGAIIVLIDEKQKTALINKKGCEVLGYSESELIGKDWFDTILPEEEREKHRGIFASLLKGEPQSVEQVEHIVLTKDRQPLTVAWQNCVLTDMHGRPVGTLSSGVDITQRKKTEQELRYARDAAEVANRAKSTFLANISHEIRTPLNAILGFCQLMQRDSSLSPSQREGVETINLSGEHLLALINEVLEMSRIELGCCSVSKVNFDLHLLLEDLEMMFRARADTKGLQFEVSRSENLPRFVVGDAGKIRQVLINLLANAVKYTDRGGVILRVFSENGHGPQGHNGGDLALTNGVIRLALEVEDTGVGISNEDRERVFQPFEQLGATNNASEGGTGLGLAITREFVSLMEGSISVSGRSDHGSIFRIVVPVGRGTEQSSHKSCRARRVVALEPGQPQYRMLVVDDNQINRDLLSSLLAAVGFEVRTADNGKLAVLAFSEWRPHAILMDMKMPVMNGRQATKVIRSLPGGDETVVVVVSAGAWEEDRKTALADGVDDFIRKPFREEELLGVLHKHIGVRYVFEPDQDKNLSDGFGDDNRDAFESISFDDLPRELTNELSEAAVSLDIDLLKGRLPQVRDLNPRTAQAMSFLLKRYDFEPLIEALNRGKDES